jgi:hypothetical protein
VRVFLHIGEPKSGSSYLQAQMWANRGFLRQHGIHLPGRAPGDHYQAGSDLQCEPIREGSSRRPQAWQWLVDRINETDARAAIVSDERLTRTGPEGVARATESLAGHDLRLIFAVREYGGLVASEWQQIVKMGGTQPLDKWLDRLLADGHPLFWRTHDVSDVLARWNVPRDRVHLLIVPAASADRNELWRRFASIVDAPAELPTHAPRSNASLGLDETELVRRIYKRFDGPPPPFAIQSVMRGVVSRQILGERDGPRPILLPEACLPWMEQQADQRKKVVVSSGCRVVGEPDELDIDRSRFVTVPDRPDPGRVLAAAEHLIVDLSGRIAGRRQRRAQHSAAATTSRPQRVRHAARHAARTFRDSVRSAWSSARGLLRRAAGRNDARASYYLLVGPPATGMGTLRRLLWCNRELLASAGVYVTGTPQVVLGRDGSGSGRSSIVARGRGHRHRRAVRSLVRDAERSGHRKVVVTDELLSCARDEEIEDLVHQLDGAEAHLVYVVRGLTTLLPAVWQEQVEAGPTPPWNEWLNTLIETPAAMPWWRAHDIDSVLHRWRRQGVDNVHLLLYPDALDPGAELGDRLGSVIGRKTSTATDRRRNHPGHSPVELLRRLRTNLDAGQLREVTDVLSSLEASDCVTFPDSARSWIEANSQRRRACLTDAGNHVVGDPQDLEPPVTAFAAPPSGPSDAALLDAAVALSAGLVAELASLRQPLLAQLGRLVAGLPRLA